MFFLRTRILIARNLGIAFAVVSCFSKGSEIHYRPKRELEFHKFRTLILINPDVALFAYEKIHHETRAPRGRAIGNENIVVSTPAYYSRIMIKYIPWRVSSVLRAWVLRGRYLPLNFNCRPINVNNISVSFAISRRILNSKHKSFIIAKIIVVKFYIYIYTLPVNETPTAPITLVLTCTRVFNLRASTE